MGSARIDPTEPTPGDSSSGRPVRHRVLKARVDSALSAADWPTLERLARTRDTSRARAVGFRLAKVLPAEAGRLESWLQGPRAVAALFALALHARRGSHHDFFALMERMSTSQPAAVERAMRHPWRRRPSETLSRVLEIVGRLLKIRPYPARAVEALVSGLEQVACKDPARSFALLAALFPAPQRVRQLASGIVGRRLLSRRTEEAAEILVEWLDQPDLARAAKESFREARRRMIEKPSRTVRARLVALRSHPRLGPLL